MPHSQEKSGVTASLVEETPAHCGVDCGSSGGQVTAKRAGCTGPPRTPPYLLALNLHSPCVSQDELGV